MNLARVSIFVIILAITASVLTNSFEGLDRRSPLLGAIVIITIADILYCWIWGLYHCLTHQFKKKFYKGIWLFLMLWLNFVGSIIYHIFVCELKLSVKSENTGEKDHWGEPVKHQITSSNWLARISILYYLGFSVVLTHFGFFQSRQPSVWIFFFGMIWLCLSIYLWIRCMLHCTRSSFKEKWLRPAWFVFIFLGLAFTATIYHIVVVELKWTLLLNYDNRHLNRVK